MKYVIEHPHRNAAKTVTIEPHKMVEGLAYKLTILEEVYSSQQSMYSSKEHTLFLYEEELLGLRTAITKALAMKLLMPNGGNNV